MSLECWQSLPGVWLRLCQASNSDLVAVCGAVWGERINPVGSEVRGSGSAWNDMKTIMVESSWVQFHFLPTRRHLGGG